MNIYRDVPVKIMHKCWHIHKINGKVHRDFCNDYGDVPVCYVNQTTNKWEDVVNNRGNAYGARKRQMYRKGYKRCRKRTRDYI